MRHKTWHVLGVCHISYASTGNVEISLCQEYAIVLLAIWLPVFQYNTVVSPSRVEWSLHYYTTMLSHNMRTKYLHCSIIRNWYSSLIHTQLENHKNSHTGNVVQHNTHIWILLIHKHHMKLCNWINFNTQKLPSQLLSVPFIFVANLNFDVNIASCLIIFSL